jgi:hypothetical protein
MTNASIAICTKCSRPVNHAGHTWWYADKDWVSCIPCQDAESPMGQLRAERDRLLADNERLRAAMAAVVATADEWIADCCDAHRRQKDVGRR